MRNKDKTFKSFFQSVWDLVGKIPYGKVATYGQIATLLGNPRAARTVGWALHSMPEDSDIPWHRVINSKGRISISCLEHSAELQRVLLEKEGIFFDQNEYIDLKKFLWQPSLEQL